MTLITWHLVNMNRSPIDYILRLISSCLVHHGASKLFHSVELHVELDQYTFTHVMSPFLLVPQVGICRRNAMSDVSSRFLRFCWTSLYLQSEKKQEQETKSLRVSFFPKQRFYLQSPWSVGQVAFCSMSNSSSADPDFDCPKQPNITQNVK